MLEDSQSCKKIEGDHLASWSLSRKSKMDAKMDAKIESISDFDVTPIMNIYILL